MLRKLLSMWSSFLCPREIWLMWQHCEVDKITFSHKYQLPLIHSDCISLQWAMDRECLWRLLLFMSVIVLIVITPSSSYSGRFSLCKWCAQVYSLLSVKRFFLYTLNILSFSLNDLSLNTFENLAKNREMFIIKC